LLRARLHEVEAKVRNLAHVYTNVIIAGVIACELVARDKLVCPPTSVYTPQSVTLNVSGLDKDVQVPQRVKLRAHERDIRVRVAWTDRAGKIRRAWREVQIRSVKIRQSNMGDL